MIASSAQVDIPQVRDIDELRRRHLPVAKTTNRIDSIEGNLAYAGRLKDAYDWADEHAPDDHRAVSGVAWHKTVLRRLTERL